jgi:hypothetical protein
MKSDFGFPDVLGLVCCGLHERLIIEQFQRVHLLPVFVVLLVLHLRYQHFLVFLVHPLQVLFFLFLVLYEGIGVFFPDVCLFLIDLLLVDFLLPFLFDLSCEVVPHLPFFVFLGASFAFLFFLLFLELVFDVAHHLVVFCAYLFLLVFDD